MARRTSGEETWHRLKEWDRGTAPSERLAALLLEIEGFQSVDPSHPLGGPDGLKDLVCDKENKNWVVGVYFPRGEVKFSQIKKKFTEDIKGVSVNNADGFIFITNQELTLTERKKLRNIENSIEIELHHLEKISAKLNSPECYGIRLDFLDIEMTKEEQLSFFTHKDAGLVRIENTQKEILKKMETNILKDKEKQVSDKHPPYRVTPVITASMMSGFMYDEIIHKCSSCSFGYIVDDPSRNAAVIWTGLSTITCPNCGNVEKY